MIIPDDICKSIKRIIGLDFKEYQINSIIDIEFYQLEDILGLSGKTEIMNSVTLNTEIQYDDFMDFYNLLLVTDMGKADIKIIKHNKYACMIGIIVTDSNKELMHRIIYNISKKERMCNE